MDGTVYVWSDTDDPHRFSPGARLSVDEGPMWVEMIRRTPDRLFIKFRGVSDRMSAEKLRGARLYIEEGQRRELGSEEYWPDQLEGLEARSPSGELVGRVKRVMWAEAQNRLVIETKAGLREVPFVEELVPAVRPEEGYLTVIDLPGLL